MKQDVCMQGRQCIQWVQRMDSDLFCRLFVLEDSFFLLGRLLLPFLRWNFAFALGLNWLPSLPFCSLFWRWRRLVLACLIFLSSHIFTESNFAYFATTILYRNYYGVSVLEGQETVIHTLLCVTLKLMGRLRPNLCHWQQQADLSHLPTKMIQQSVPFAKAFFWALLSHAIPSFQKM